MSPLVRSVQDRRGFVLAFVVLMLFAISVAGATGYLVVSSEFAMARDAHEASEALTVARAGLDRFAAEQIGVVGDSVAYALGDGVALVTSRKLYAIDANRDMYYLRSEGTVTNIFAPSTPARRVVGTYAIHHRRPVRHHAAFFVTAEGSWARGSDGEIDGRNHSAPGDCPTGNAPTITGTIAQYNTGQLSGGFLNSGELWNVAAAVVDSFDLRWDVLTDPGFPVDFDGVPPNFASLPPDSFPVVRVSGYFPADGTWSGRGVLIVDGELDAGPSFDWDGIILAGSVDDIHEAHIRGMLIAGFDGPNSYSNVYWDGKIEYYSCLVEAANESLSYLELVPNTIFELD